MLDSEGSPGEAEGRGGWGWKGGQGDVIVVNGMASRGLGIDVAQRALYETSEGVIIPSDLASRYEYDVSEYCETAAP